MSRRVKRPALPAARPEVQRVWSGVRQLRRFTLDDLVAVTECAIGFVRRCIHLWRRHAIVHRDNDGFRLARDLGALPPYEAPHAVGGLVDRNRGEVLPAVDPTRRYRGVAEAASGRAKQPGSGRKRLAVPPSAEEQRARQREYQRRYRERRRQRSEP